MSLIEVLRELGLLGVFVSSFLGHLSIVMKDVLFIPIFLYVSSFWDPVLMGLVGGVGGGLGELGAYMMGRGVGRLRADRQKGVEVPNWARRLGLFSVLLCSLTPLPDAPVLMLIGSARFPVLAVLALEILGKVLLYTIVAAAGGIVFSNIAAIVPTPWNSVLIVALSISVTVVATSKRTTSFISRLAQRTVNKIPGFRKRKACGQCFLFTTLNTSHGEKQMLAHGSFFEPVPLRSGYGACMLKAKMVSCRTAACSNYRDEFNGLSELDG